MSFDGYKIVVDGGSSYTLKNVILSAHTYAVYARAITKLVMKNTGATVQLLDSKGLAIDTATVGAAREGMSWARAQDGKFAWTLPTRAAPNRILVSTSANMGVGSTIAALRASNRRGVVVVRGVVTAAPQGFGNKMFYIADATGGIQISTPQVHASVLEGDRVEVRGSMGTIQGERRVNVSRKEDGAVLSHEASPIPQQVSIGDIDENFEGRLVTLSGMVASHQGTTLTVEDEGSEIPVSLSRIRTRMHALPRDGATVHIAGMVSQTKNGFRIVPRQASDVEIVDAPAQNLQDQEVPLANTNPKASSSAVPVTSALTVIAVAAASGILGILIKHGISWKHMQLVVGRMIRRRKDKGDLAA